MYSEKPRKMYNLTNDGKDVLEFSENSLNMFCKNMVTDGKIRVTPSIETRLKIY